jgi:activating signal cointegrator 1
MKAITLTQPWATLVAIGAKCIETRSWATAYRGRLAIHAAKGLGPVGGKRGLTELCGTEPFCSVLNVYGRSQTWKDLADMVARPLLPQGAIVAICELTAVWRIPATPRHFPRGVADDHPHASYPVVLPPFRDTAERAFGDYTPGRYAWILSDVKALYAPIATKGALGLWEWDGTIPVPASAGGKENSNAIS